MATLPALAAEPDFAGLIEAQRHAWSAPGVAVAIVQGDRAQSFASGLCDVARKRVCTPDSEFPIASNTKFFTGLLAATLVVENVVSLDEPIQKAWPEFRLSDPRWTEVTLRDLLSQRSGIGSVEWPYYWEPSLNRADYLARLPFVPMAQPFRARWAYSNANFVAAGAYLERNAGASWEDLVKRKILAPLGMKHTRVGPPQANAPAGSLVSTANDYARFLAMVLDEGHAGGKQILPAKALRLATTLSAPMGYDRRFYSGPGGYAFGIYVANYGGHLVLHHPGGYLDYTAHVVLVPDAKLGVAVLCNRNATLLPQALALGLVDLALGSTPDENLRKWQQAEEPPEGAPKAEQPAPPTRSLQDFAGRYSHPAWGTFDVRVAGDGLRIRLGKLDAALDHYRYDSFSFESAPGWERLRLRFDDDFEGRIEAFVLDDQVNPQPMRFEKLKE